VGELDKVLAFDQKLAESVDQIDKDIKTLESLGDKAEMNTGLRGLVELIRKVDEALNEREQILRTLGGEALEK
jgi:hypothetical protein